MNKVVRKLNRALDILNTAFFNILCAIVLWQVICRYVLNYSSPWTEEIARYLLVSITFLGAAIATRDRSHLVAMDLFARAPRMLAILHRVAIEGIVIVIFAILLHASLDLVEIGAMETTTSMLWLKMSYVYSILPISFGLIIVYSFVNIVKVVIQTPDEEKTEE